MIEIIQAVILRSEDQNEFDKRLTLYTREFGKIKAKVSGVKKNASKLRSLTIPFSECRLQVYLHGGKRAGMRDPGKVIGGEILNLRGAVRDNWEALIQASAVCEIIETMTHPFFPNPNEYELLNNALNELEHTPQPLLVRLRFTLMLLKMLGYSLRHHPVWKSFSPSEQELLKKLAYWDAKESAFSNEESHWLLNSVSAYLSRYLNFPLKTDVFQQKILAAGTAS